MLIGKKEFIAGILMATISVSAATKLTSLYAVENGFSSEVEFSQRIGLFDSERLSEKTLKSNIAEIAFYRGLSLILVDKGIVSSFNPSHLESLGITNTAAPMCSITRQKATETIFRALMFANSRGIISIPNRSKDIEFMDWTPNEKYQDTAVFAIKNNVLKGVGQNVFKPSKKLTVREALILLQRLHELDIKQVAFDTATEKKMEKTAKKKQKADVTIPESPKSKTIYIEPEVQKFFKDISVTNPMADTMKKLINAGAFDITSLNHEANLPKSIKVSDFVKICKGMMNKAGKPEVCSQVEAAVGSAKADEAISRDTVAMIGSAIVDAYAHKEYNINPNYSDVAADSSTGKALQHIAKAGIRMGYPDGSFKGNEKVSRYEAFNLLNIIVGDNVGTRIKITTFENSQIPALQPAENKDASEVKTQKSAETKKVESGKDTTAQAAATTKASKLEQQLSDKYDGLSFKERIEMRKAQFQRILNREE